MYNGVDKLFFLNSFKTKEKGFSLYVVWCTLLRKNALTFVNVIWYKVKMTISFLKVAYSSAHTILMKLPANFHLA